MNDDGVLLQNRVWMNLAKTEFSPLYCTCEVKFTPKVAPTFSLHILWADFLFPFFSVFLEKSTSISNIPTCNNKSLPQTSSCWRWDMKMGKAFLNFELLGFLFFFILVIRVLLHLSIDSLYSIVVYKIWIFG